MLIIFFIIKSNLYDKLKELNETNESDENYIVDDEYCSRATFDPLYFKGTEVYFLYFPGSMEGSYIGGVVVRKKA